MGLSGGNHSFYKQTDVFTGTGTGALMDASFNPVSNFTLSVIATGSVSLWTIILEGSIDGANFSVLATHTNLIGSGASIFPGVNITPCLYFRTRCSVLTLGLGTSVTATVLGAQ